jgi:hypothetical protein
MLWQCATLEGESSSLPKHTEIMKHLLLQSIACCAALLPFSQAEARTYGGFAPGKTFTLTVTEKVTKKFVLSDVTKNVAVPGGIPNFEVGQAVTFTIGPKGQLTAEGMSIPFEEAVANLNEYWIPPTWDNPSGDLGQVTKNWRNQPRKVFLSFGKLKFVGLTPTTFLVTYTLK